MGSIKVPGACPRWWPEPGLGGVLVCGSRWMDAATVRALSVHQADGPDGAWVGGMGSGARVPGGDANDVAVVEPSGGVGEAAGGSVSTAVCSLSTAVCEACCGVGMLVASGVTVSTAVGVGDTAVSGVGVPVDAGVGTGAGVNVAGTVVSVCSAVAGGVGVDAAGGGVEVGCGVLLTGGSGVGGDVGLGPGTGTGAGDGWSVGIGLAAGDEVGVDAEGSGASVAVGVAEAVCTTTSAPSSPWSAIVAGTTRTVTWALAALALEALIVAVLVQVPGATARTVTSFTPPVPGSSAPIDSVKPEGVKQPPLMVSVSQTFSAVAEPVLP